MITYKDELFAGLLYVNQEIDPNRYIDSRRKIQKLTFLAQNFLQDLQEDIAFDFKPHNYGPYSRKLRANIEFQAISGNVETKEHIVMNFIDDYEEETERTAINTRYDYRLSNNGINIMKNQFKNYLQENKFILYGLKNLGLINGDILIAIVYRLYPDMAIRSKIIPRIRNISKEEMKLGLKFFFRALPKKLVLKIFNSNKNFSYFFPKIETDLSFKVYKMGEREENLLLDKVISDNYSVLKDLAEY